jgi:hypothetical protein
LPALLRRALHPDVAAQEVPLVECQGSRRPAPTGGRAARAYSASAAMSCSLARA